MLMDDQLHTTSEDHSSFFFQLVNKYLPSDDTQEEKRSLSTKKYILWMAGIMTGFFILRTVFSLLFL
jgi:hypothetical protein